MESIRSLICSLIGKQSLETITPEGIGLQELRSEAAKIMKNIPRKTQFSSISKFFYDIFNCKDFFPEPPGFCIDNGDCDPGSSCKQGTCVSDPGNCVNAGCPDEGYQCDEGTGNCYFVPECETNAECDSIEGGETCIKSVCKVPPICISGIGVDICAPTWECIGGECKKADCSVIDSSNKYPCCNNDAAFSTNQASCCLYSPSDPRCPVP